MSDDFTLEDFKVIVRWLLVKAKIIKPRIKEERIMLFEIAIVKIPTRNERKDGKQEELVYWTDKPIVADDAQSAVVSVMLDNPQIAQLPRNQIEVHCRPFD